MFNRDDVKKLYALLDKYVDEISELK